MLPFKSLEELFIPYPLYLCNLVIFHGRFKKFTYLDILLVVALEL